MNISIKNYFEMFNYKSLISKGDSDLGKGAYGVIYLANQKEIDLAIKRNFAYKDSSFISVLKEINVLLVLRKNPYICNILSYSFGAPFKEKIPEIDLEEYKDFRDDKIFFVLEKANYDLHNYIYLENNEDYNHKNSIKIIYHILLGLKFMHQNKIIHRDIKPSNILITIKDGELSAKICDFGFAKFNTNQVMNSPKICTHYYRAPEIVFYYGNYDYKIDVWALGLIIYELFSKKSYLHEDTKDDHVKIIENLARRTHPDESLDYLIKGVKDKFKKEESINFSEIEKFGDMYTSRFKWNESKVKEFDSLTNNNLHNLEDLLFGMLRFNPKLRFSTDDCLNHKLFNDHKKLLTDYQEKYLSKITNEDRIIKISYCFERNFAVEIILDLFNNRNLYNENSKLNQKYHWYSHRILFHTIDLFDQYIFKVNEIDKKKYTKINKNSDDEEINGYYMNADEVRQMIFVILYGFYKFFSTFSVDVTFKKFVNIIDSTINVDAKYLEEAEKIECQIFEEAFGLFTYNVTLFEIADDFNKINNNKDITLLLTIYSTNESISGKSLREIYEKFSKLGNMKPDEIQDYVF